MPNLPVRAALAAAILPVALAPLPGAAQTPFDLGEITLSANRIETPIDATGASVIVITEDELRAAGDILLAAFLARLPGVTVTQDGPIGAQASIRIRGADGAYVAVIIDGIRVTDPSAPQVRFDFGSLRASDVARIEVVKGSQSALYGGSAVGGVVVITTRRAQAPGVRQQITAEGGSRETAGLTYALTQKGARHELAFTASRFSTAGFSAADARDGNTEADGHRATRLSLTGRFELSDSLALGFAAFGQRTRTEYDEGFPLGDGTPDEVAREESLGARIFAELRTGAVSHTLGLSRYRIERRYVESNLFGPADNTYTGARTALDYQGSTALGSRATLVWGADWTEESYDQAGTFGALTADTRTAGLWGQLLASPAEGLDVSVTLRLDDHSAFGRFATGRLAAAWRVSEAVTLKGAVSNGFRAPSPFELYSFFGDPGLKPEESLSAEVGAELRLAGGARLSATLFALETSNLITYDFAAGRYANVPGRTERRGLELAATLPLGERASLAASYTYTDTETAAGTRLPRVPRHEGTVTLDARLTDRLSGQIGLHGAADVVDGGAKLGDFVVVNAGLRYRVTESASAFLRVENLFDEHYQRVRGYGTPGRGLFAGITAEF